MSSVASLHRSVPSSNEIYVVKVSSHAISILKLQVGMTTEVTDLISQAIVAYYHISLMPSVHSTVMQEEYWGHMDHPKESNPSHHQMVTWYQVQAETGGRNH